ncbi:MAG: MBL fold metallo-hydrolase [Bacteriodetes bacterium]|nr:MBL fold metallo-hydrolase [Bacteroidota bacterium]
MKTHNPELRFIKEGWNGNPLDANGRYVNQYNPFMPELKKLIRWQTERNPHRQEKKRDTFTMLINTSGEFLTSTNDCIVWLGHATFFMRLGGTTLLLDPVLSSIGSTVKRKSPLPVTINQLTNIDYIFLSHDHRDHADKPSIQALFKQNPHVKFRTSLGCDELLYSWTKTNAIQAAGWYQQYTGINGFEAYFLPSRHWGRRLFSDTNKRLWGAFIFKTPTHTIYFSGDTGYDAHLPEVAQLFGTIDYCIIGAGAYKPEWFMGSAHISPTNAVRAAEEMNARYTIPMHFGTFDLSDEPLGDPYRVLQKLSATSRTNILFPALGEEVVLQ